MKYQHGVGVGDMSAVSEDDTGPIKCRRDSNEYAAGAGGIDVDIVRRLENGSD